MSSVEPNGQPVSRPDGFDLHEAWKLITEQVESKRTPVIATALVSPESSPMLRWILGTRVRIGPAGSDGRIEVELRGHNVRSLAGEIAGFGNSVEVLDPPELRALLAQIGTQLAATYT
jgi:predicted DNA-binding transcriptional regulator YafY